MHLSSWLSNRKLALFGIGTYVLSVLTSAEDLNGNLLSPPLLILLSGVATVAFTVLAPIRLWKTEWQIGVLFAGSTLILFAVSIFQESVASVGGSIILLLSLTKIVHFASFAWAVIMLYHTKKT